MKYAIKQKGELPQWLNCEHGTVRMWECAQWTTRKEKRSVFDSAVDARSALNAARINRHGAKYENAIVVRLLNVSEAKRKAAATALRAWANGQALDDGERDGFNSGTLELLDALVESAIAEAAALWPTKPARGGERG